MKEKLIIKSLKNMLSVKKISLEQSSTYYSKDNYYTQQLGEWFGKGKEDLELGDLTHESFQSLLRGINPQTGETLTPSKANQAENVPAIDFTFSAPKSLSALYEIAEATNNKELSLQLQEAHNQAVNSALLLVEKNHIKTRIQKDGTRKSINTDYLLTGKFQHDTSRDLDPQLHTHCVAMNFTKIDGKYRSLDLQNLLKKDSPIIKNIGQYYRFKLKENLEKQGFQTVQTNGKEVFFQLKEIDEKLIETFSNRRAAIEIKAKELKAKFPKMEHNMLYQKATLESRKSKKDVDRNQIFQENLKIAKSLIDTDKLLQKIFKPKVIEIVKPIEEKSLEKVIKKAEKSIIKDKHKTVDNITVKAATLSYGKKIDIDTIRNRVEQLHKNKETAKVYSDMKAIVKRELKLTKLDTYKLFSTHSKLERIKNSPLVKEEVKENAKRHKSTNDAKFIKRYDRETINSIRNDVKKSRDTIDVSRDINTRYRARKGKSGVEFERLDVDSNRSAGKNINQAGDRVSLTQEDIDRLNQYVAKKHEELKTYKKAQKTL